MDDLNDFEYDFYICHHEDDISVATKILEKLESDNVVKGFQEDRDGHPGMRNLGVIEYAIQHSKYILLLLSPSAVQNNWFEHKVHTSLQHRLDNPPLISTVIPVYMSGMDSEQVPSSLRVIVGITYENTDNFWSKLQRTVKSVVNSW